MGDLRAQIAANNTGIKRVIELVEQYGVKKVNYAMDAILDYSERRIREEIRRMPDGTYFAVDYMESISPAIDDLNIQVKIIKDQENLIFDYSGTHAQVDNPINAPLGVTVAGIYFTLISITDPTIPVNDGCFRPITLNIPLGCMMNPTRPSPVAGGNVETSQRNADVLMKAFSKIVPEKVPAAGQGTMNNITIGGLKDNGEPWTFYETIGGGSGARPDRDGVDGIHVNMTNTMNTPIETLEAYSPLEFKAYRLRRDSGGAGKYRGGCGIERIWTLTSAKATLSIMAERNKIQPWGLAGGLGGATGEYILVKSDGTEIRLPSKCTVSVARGDTLIIKTPGGGGYGNPRDRSSEMIKEDILNDLISIETAREIYQYTGDVA
jgi:N-methylhydantoinase B